jgi:hypothetical protein
MKYKILTSKQLSDLSGIKPLNELNPILRMQVQRGNLKKKVIGKRAVYSVTNSGMSYYKYMFLNWEKNA